MTAIRKRDRGESSIEESNCNFVKKLQNKCKKYTSHYQDIDFSLTKVPDFLGYQIKCNCLQVPISVNLVRSLPIL